MLRQGALSPSQLSRINFAHPLARGLISAWTPGFLWSRIPRPANGGTPVTGPFGIGVSFNGTSDSVSLGPRAFAHATPDSRFALIKVGSASSTRTISAGGNNGVGFRTNGTSLEILQTGVSVTLTVTSAVSSGEFCSVGMVNAAALAELYKNGTRIGANGSGNFRTDNGTDFIGQNGASAQYWDGHVYLHLAWNRVLTSAEMRLLDDDPWQLFKPIAVPVKTTASGSYTLTADSAAWNFAAQDAALKVARKLSAANAPWEFAAQSAGLKVARKITADNAAWEFAAQDATLTYTLAGAYVLTAESTGWQFAVPDATLTYTPIQGDRASGGFAWLEYISDREREEYRKKRREVYQNAPKRVTAVVKKVAQKAAIEQREPEPEEIEQAFQSEGVAYQPDYGQMAQNAYRLYLQLLINRRKLEQEAEREREQTRQFLAEQTRIALEDQQRRAQLIEEEAVFMTVAALLLELD